MLVPAVVEGAGNSPLQRRGASVEDGNTATAALNGTQLCGRTLNVNEARPSGGRRAPCGTGLPKMRISRRESFYPEGNIYREIDRDQGRSFRRRECLCGR